MKDNSEILQILEEIGYHSLAIIEETKDNAHPNDSTFLQHAAMINKLGREVHQILKKHD